MTLGDIDEPPENFSTRRNAQKIHFAGFLLCVSLLFEVSGVVGGRVSQSRVLGYFLGPDDNDSSAALVQIEMKLVTARGMDSLDIAVNTYKEYIIFHRFISCVCAFKEFKVARASSLAFLFGVNIAQAC